MNHLYTKWGRKTEAENLLPEYPRPCMVRPDWLSLNGFWEYCFTDADCIPKRFSGKIRVPFSPESPLSGIERQLKPDEFLWYRRFVSLKSITLNTGTATQAGRILLHFGAVDQYCEIYVNRKKAGRHMGGYLPFTLDITDYLSAADGFDEDTELLVMVRDESDTSWHSRGKQKLRNSGMFYTAQSGIWQTVWLESVPDNYMENIRFTPDYDASRLRVLVTTARKCPVTCVIKSTGQAFQFFSNCETELALPEFHSWSPEDPFLYEVKLTAGADQADSYFAMRKCDIQTDAKGVRRIFLNNLPYLQIGVLDQGYWPDGLYTASADEAMVFDILSMKNLGFNMLRKHMKIEPQRWYYHCDRLGMLVWQDMVCGGTTYNHWFVTYLATLFNYLQVQVRDGVKSRSLLSRREQEGIKETYEEVRLTVESLYNHPSIVCWTPFNEGWGQFDALKMTDFLRRLDSTRLIDHASGWFDQGGGDLTSLHYYFFTLKYKKEAVRALALTEFGGYSWLVPGHSYSNRLYGYGKFDSRQSLTAGYRKLIRSTVLPAVREGISATVYTQLSDVEEEVNGLYTYDREILKPDADTVRLLNAKMRQALQDALSYNLNNLLTGLRSPSPLSTSRQTPAHTLQDKKASSKRPPRSAR